MGMGAGVVQSQILFSESAKAGLPFLRIAPSAVTAGMAGSGVAMTGGAVSRWLNPSVMAFTTVRCARFSHTQLVEGIRQEYVSISGKTGLGHLGAAAQIYDSGDIDGYSDNATPTGTYSIKYTALSLSYARLLTEDIAVGLTYKMLFEKIAEEDAGGYAVDAGISWKTPVEGLSAGAALRNFGRMEILKNERTKLPSDMSAGLLYRGVVPNIGKGFVLAADYVAPRYGSKGVRLGLEVEPLDRFYLRTGYRSDSDFEDVSFGVGMIIGMFSADVAYTPMTEFSDNALRFTLSLAGF